MSDTENDNSSAGSFRVGTRTDIGHRRERNEDFLGVSEVPYGKLLIVCDGMGGHRGGERASRLAVEVFTQILREETGDLEKILPSAVAKANSAVHDEAKTSASLSGMGTTLVAAVIHGSTASIVNVGDSRAYLFRNGRVERVTRDHSLVEELIAQGKITESEGAIHPQRNIITRALGTEASVRPDLFKVELRDGDGLLLASDGLHGLISDGVIGRIIAENPAPEKACDELVRAALEAGGIDNVTVALLRFGKSSMLAAGTVEPDTAPPGMGGGTPKTPWPLIVIAMAAITFGWFLFFSKPWQDDNMVPPADTAGVQGFIDSLGGLDSLVNDSTQLTPFDEIRDSAPAGWYEDSLTPLDTARRDSPIPLPLDRPGPGPGR